MQRNYLFIMVHNKKFHCSLSALFYSIVFLTFCIRFVIIYYSVLEFYGDEAQYWLWSRNLSFGYFSKPPIVAWLIWITTSIVNDTEYSARVSSIILHCITACIVKKIAEELNNIPLYKFYSKNKTPVYSDIQGLAMLDNTYDNSNIKLTTQIDIKIECRKNYIEKIGFWAGITYLTLPSVALSSMIISTDPALVLFLTLSMWLFIKALHTNNTIFWYLLGASLGLGMLSKYNALYFIPSSIIYLYLTKTLNSNIKRYCIALVIAIIVYLPNLIWNMTHEYVSYMHTFENARGPQSHTSLRPSIIFLCSQLATLGPIVFIGYTYASFNQHLYRKIYRQWILLQSFIIPVLVTIFTIALLSRAHPNWAAPAYVAIVLVFVIAIYALNKVWLIQTTVIIGISINILIFMLSSNIITINTSKYDPFIRMKGYKNIAMTLNQYCIDDPSLVLAIDGRMEYAKFAYYAPKCRKRMVRWSQYSRYADHFSMTTDLNKFIGSNVLLITPKNMENSYLSIFANSIKQHSDASITPSGIIYHFYFLQAFKGY